MALLIGASRQLEAGRPEIAVGLYPFNTNAVVRDATSTLSRDVGADELKQLRKQLQHALYYDRVDSRLFSLLGEIAFRLNEPDEATSFFDHAFRLSKTDILALYQMLSRSVQAGRPVEAVGYLDILLRRWPEQFDQVTPVLPALLSNPESYEMILTRLEENPPWRRRLINSLSQQEDTALLIGRLLLDLRSRKSPPTSTELSVVISRYIAQKRYEEAYRMFLFSLEGKEQELNGYVFNSGFAPVATQRPFDWQRREQAGVQIDIPADGSAGSGAAVRFLDKPVKKAGLQQFLHLPPGSYRLSMNASGRGLKLPRGLYWSIRCHDPSRELVHLDVPEGSYENTTRGVDFQIVRENCPLQLLQLETGLIADSWRYRYSGTLTLHRLNIEKSES